MDTIKIEQEESGWMQLYVNNKLVASTDNVEDILKYIRTLLVADGMII